MKNKKTKHQPHSAGKQTKKVPTGNVNYLIGLLIILVVSFIVYMPAIHNGFINWDDDKYIQNNALIRSLNLKAIFSEYQLGNYHPLTMLVYAIEYRFWGLSEAGYHVVNLFLHLFNVVLVYYAIFLLSNKGQVALVAALLFGVHPLHVESVAWAAELKDLLYTLFFLASYIFYLKYYGDSRKKFLFISLLLFVLSLLSKAMAASLPVLLVLTDYFKGRKINVKTLLEKAPYFILAIALGVVAIFAQKSSNAIQDFAHYTFPQRIAFASYGFIMYLVKLVVPVNLCANYPYPDIINSGIPAIYYLFILLAAALFAFIFYSVRFSKKIIFSLGFFSITVFLVLQLLPVGNVIMADRYAYLPSVGIFYLAAEGFYWLWNKNKKAIALGLTGAFALFFSAQAYSRCTVWKNSLTLWNDVIEKYQNVPVAYNNRGLYLYNEKRYDEAFSDCNKAIALSPTFGVAFNLRGILLLNAKKNEEALADFNKALDLQPGFAEGHSNRGLAELYLGKNDDAEKDFNRAIELQPDYYQAYFNRGLLWTNEKKNDRAYDDYSRVIQLQPAFTQAYVNRGIILHNTNRLDEALADYSKAVAFDPSIFQIYYNMGLIYMSQKNPVDAISSFSKTIELSPGYAPAFFNRGIIENNLGRKSDACTDLQQAAKLGYEQANSEYQKDCR